MTTGRSENFPIGAAVTIEGLEGDPKPILTELRAAEPVSWIPALEAWWVTRRDLAVEAMRDADAFTVDDPRFTTAAVLGPSMLSLEGAEHERHRSPFAPAFRPGILREQFDEFLGEQVAALIDGLGAGTGELRHGLAGPLAVNTITEFLGLEGVTAAEVLDWYQSISRAITNLTLGEPITPGDTAAVATVHERVQQTLDSATSDSLLVSIERTGLLRPEEMSSATVVLMFGAIETAEGMTANVFWHLLTTDGAWATVAADRSLLANAIDESLRFEPAASLIDRYTTRDVELGGVEIPEGELVTISLLGANHDPALFDDPHRYDLTRANARQHVTFVQGPHACLGLHLARMQTAAAVSAMLDAAPNLVLDPDTSSAPAGLIFRKPDRLSVTW